MKRDEVLSIVVKNIKEIIPEMKDEEIDMNKSYRELDINSLDLVEIVSASMNELKIKIPMNELANIKNTGGLVDVIFKVVNGARA